MAVRTDPAGVDPSHRAALGFERTLEPEQRRRLGVHATPPQVALAVLSQAFAALGRPPQHVLDPSCGAGAFLLAVADELFAAGVPAEQIVTERLVGMELDPTAAQAARDHLADWATRRGSAVDPQHVRIHVGDGLGVEPADWPDRPVDGFDLVVGNPPFLGQLARPTARTATRRALVSRRFGPAGPYTDDAALFLLAAVDLVAPGGVVSLLQPQSFLAARDTATVRDALLDRCQLAGLWADPGRPFPDAEVHVCAPVLVRHGRGSPPDPGGRCAVTWPADGLEEPRRTSMSDEAVPAPGEPWGTLLGAMHGLPPLPELWGSGRVLGDVATTTAGFRDEFYALSAAAVDGSRAAEGEGEGPPGAPRLVTVGMIDPWSLRWDVGTHRLGGVALARPTLDRHALATDAPKVDRWVADRLVPKVLVATQTKVVEALVDPVGDLVPVTPVISVEPLSDQLGPWELAAALGSPPVSLWALRTHLGSGRSATALRWSARSVRQVPLPANADAWARGTELARAAQEAGSVARRHELLDRFGAVMATAYGLAADDRSVRWWSDLRPRR